MATYAFKCSSCDEEFEVSMKISQYKEEIRETKSIKCVVCGKKATLQMSCSSFHLKGSGWYVTDYKNKSPVKKKDKG